MGQWHISIRGTGVHHNGPEQKNDAEKMAARFAQELKDAGHTVHAAAITYGGEQDITPPVPHYKL